MRFILRTTRRSRTLLSRLTACLNRAEWSRAVRPGVFAGSVAASGIVIKAGYAHVATSGEFLVAVMCVATAGFTLLTGAVALLDESDVGGFRLQPSS
jgi:hypothetical protein